MAFKLMLLAGHQESKPGCDVTIDGKLITEFSLAEQLCCEIFKREHLANVDTVIKKRNDFNTLVSEVNAWNPDLLISCHLNAADGTAQGTEVLAAATSTKSQAIAKKMQSILVKHLGLHDRGIKLITKADRGGSILNKTKCRAILIEPFFLDSVKTKAELDDLLSKTADAIMEFISTL